MSVFSPLFTHGNTYKFGKHSVGLSGVGECSEEETGDLVAPNSVVGYCDDECTTTNYTTHIQNR